MYCVWTRDASSGDSRVESAFGGVKPKQFIRDERFRPVVRNQHLQFSPCVDAPRICPCFYQRRFGVVVLGKENRFSENLGEHHAEGQPQRGEQLGFVRLYRRRTWDAWDTSFAVI